MPKRNDAQMSAAMSSRGCVGYGPWAELEIGERFVVRSAELPVAALARRVRGAAYQWQARLPGRSFHIVEEPESVRVERTA